MIKLIFISNRFQRLPVYDSISVWCNNAYLDSRSALFCNIFIDKIQDRGKNGVPKGVIGWRMVSVKDTNGPVWNVKKY